MHDAYRACFFAPCPVVFGQQLRPYQLGHAALLDALESPLVGHKGAVTLDAVALVVWVCSRDASKRMEQLRDPGSIGAQIKPLLASLKKMTRREIADAALVVSAYIGEHCKAPPRWSKGGENSLRVPWQFALLYRATKGNTSPEAIAAAWDTPLPYVTTMAACAGADAGDDSLVSEDEQEIIDKARAEQAAKEASNGKG